MFGCAVHGISFEAVASVLICIPFVWGFYKLTWGMNDEGED